MTTRASTPLGPVRSSRPVRSPRPVLAAALCILVGGLCGTLAPAAAAPAKLANPKAEIATTAGTIVIELNAEKAPQTVANFIRYAKDGFYEGTIFHRVISDFMIQGGGLDRNLKEKPTRAPVRNESENGLSNLPYTVAMARTADPHSATSQFFINVKDNSSDLDSGKTSDGWGYTVFGRVIEGQDVVDKIKQVHTRPRGITHQNVPVEPVVIESVKIIE